ncbi:MAG: hypothetical protein JWQ48_2724 [Conexibacter sp.]|jgi:hypothetical protein|nr:hypothetical protein [Conexibacter sp.]
MTTRAAFNAEEWARIATAPVLTGMLVISAERGGTIRESVSMARAYQEAREHHPTELLGELIATPPAIEQGSAPRTFDDLRREVPARLGAAIALLAERATPEEVADYKRFVYRVAETVARAHKEGGVLGIGGKEISPREQAVLDELAALFDRTQP